MKLNPKNFQENLTRLELTENPKILVAVSGGIDSMVLVDILEKLKFTFSIAHCNFQLRGEGSNLDAEFLKNYANQREIEIFIQEFDVKSYKESGNFSTQMAARNLRYDWFLKLKNQHSFDCSMTAHHLNDSLETFLINLSRGTGINGLKGIQSDQRGLIRPLLPFSKSAILSYAQENNIQWREDVSNSSTDYVRNKIRHEIEPHLNEIHPNFLENFYQSLAYLHSEAQMLENHLDQLKKEIWKEENGTIYVSIDELKKLKPLSSYLHHLFHPFGFAHPKEIEKLLKAQNNSEITSSTHRLIKNEPNIWLKKKQEVGLYNEIELDQEQILEKPLYLRFSKSEQRDFNSSEAIDYDKIKWPLRLRKRRTGEIFFPIGMKGSKKISKFFKDEKYSKLEKEEAWLLVDDADRIVYVIGKRLDERFKITENTHTILNIYLC